MSPEKVCLHFPHYMQLVRPLCSCDLLVGLFVDSRCRCERRLHRACRVHAHPCVLTDHRVQDQTRSLPRPVDKGIYLEFGCNDRRAQFPEGHGRRGSSWRNAGRYARVCVHAWALFGVCVPPCRCAPSCLACADLTILVLTEAVNAALGVPERMDKGTRRNLSSLFVAEPLTFILQYSDWACEVRMCIVLIFLFAVGTHL